LILTKLIILNHCLEQEERSIYIKNYLHAISRITHLENLEYLYERFYQITEHHITENMQCKCNVKLAVIVFIIIKGYTITAPLYTSFKHAAREIYTGVVNSVSLLFFLVE
jgi:hypothetical protein